MNKALLFPLVFMFILTMFAAVWGQTGFYNTVNGEPGNISVSGGSAEFDMWSVAGIMVLLFAAVAIGTIAGMHFLGSGLSDTSQNIIFTSILFLGLWACLTVISRNYLFDSAITMILWIALTVMYVVGVGTTVTGASG